ncbi:MAG: ATP-binding protein [Flavisolibacter sp.]
MNHTEKLTSEKIDQNAESLAREITWFASVVKERLSDYLSQEKKDSTTSPQGSGVTGTNMIDTPPDLSDDHSVYADFVRYYHLTTEERILLMLALIPHVQPHLLDVFFSINKSLNRSYTEFGGVRGLRHGGFIPTIETALFLLAKNDLHKRFRLHGLFEPDHVFLAHNIIVLEQSGNEPFYSSALGISDEYIDFFTTGKIRKPAFSMDFPAKRLKTQMEWTDLVIDDFTSLQLDEIRIWLEYGRTFSEDWGMSKKIRPGFKALFHGPPGTGKTLTAALLGKLFKLDVYRIDLSMVVSKYIGETGKNLERVFKKAENKNWILFFDEADALFGKRTSISDAHDKYANQEISYLLQRLEDYPGLIVLASNMRNNVDEAFTRRLQSIIHFQKPQPAERLKLWINAFSERCTPPPRRELEQIAQQFELSGGAIMNAVQYASLKTLNRHEAVIRVEDLIEGIKKEFRKEGKTL